MASDLKNKCWFVTRSLEAEYRPRIATRSHGSWRLLLAFVFKPKVLTFFCKSTFNVAFVWARG